MKFINGLYTNLMDKLVAVKKNEEGSQTLEWIGIAAVIIIVVGLISTAFDGSDIGSDIYDKFKGFLDKIGGGSGG